MNSTRSKVISTCSILTALGVVLMLAAGAIGIGTYAGPMLASIVLIPVFLEYGPKMAMLCYIAVSVISFLFAFDREMSVFYILMGWYPVVLPYINNIKSGILKIVIKLSIYGAIVFALYGLIGALLGFGLDTFTGPRVLWYVLGILGAVCFLLLDIIYAKAAYLWKTKWKKIFKV